MRIPVAAVAAVSAVAFALGACAGDDAASGPMGPAPTDVDPGPRDTSGGPETVQGTLRLGGDCLVLETGGDRLELTFDGYAVGEEAGARVLVANADGRTVAPDGATVVLTGFRATGEPAGGCGVPFQVDSFNSVLE